MVIKSVSKEELETMSYDDVAYIVLKEKGKKMKTLDLFNDVSKNMGLDPKLYEDKIGDFFTLLATEKRFIQLDKGFWDLRENHQIKIEIKDDEEETEIETIDEVTEEDDEEEKDEISFYDEKEPDDDDEEDDLKDLVIVDETDEVEL